MFYNEKKVQRLRELYPEGTRICIDHMDDPNPIESGTLGTVEYIDDAGTLHCSFDNGRNLGVIYGEDSFHIVTQKEENVYETEEDEEMKMEVYG